MLPTFCHIPYAQKISLKIVCASLSLSKKGNCKSYSTILTKNFPYLYKLWGVKYKHGIFFKGITVFVHNNLLFKLNQPIKISYHYPKNVLNMMEINKKGIRTDQNMYIMYITEVYIYKSLSLIQDNIVLHVVYRVLGNKYNGWVTATLI